MRDYGRILLYCVYFKQRIYSVITNNFLITNNIINNYSLLLIINCKTIIWS